MGPVDAAQVGPAQVEPVKETKHRRRDVGPGSSTKEYLVTAQR
jgi:hypothetical protein